MSKNKNLYGSILIIISAILFGFMPFLTKIAYSQGSNAFSVAFGRFFFGWISLVILHLLTKKRIQISKNQLLEIAKLSFVFAFVPVLLYLSYTFIDSGLATTLHFSYPIAVILIERIILKRKMKRLQIICTILCTLGILLLYKPNGNMNLTGLLIAIISGIVYALYIVLLARKSFDQIPGLTLVLWLSFFSYIEIGSIALLSGQITCSFSLVSIFIELILGVMTMCLATPFFQKGVFYCGGVKASLLSTFEPLTSLIIGFLFFKEILTIRDGFGILCILIATILLILKKQ